MRSLIKQINMSILPRVKLFDGSTYMYIQIHHKYTTVPTIFLRVSGQQTSEKKKNFVNKNNPMDMTDSVALWSRASLSQYRFGAGVARVRIRSVTRPESYFFHFPTFSFVTTFFFNLPVFSELE